MDFDEKLTLKLKGGAVRRYHTEGNVISQSVAEHTWRVVVLLLHLWPDCSRELLLAAQYHDVAEGFTGDLPAPFKRLPGVKKLINSYELNYEDELGIFILVGAEDAARLKCADLLEGYLTTQNVQRMELVHRNYLAYLREHMKTMAPADQKLVNSLIGLCHEDRTGQDHPFGFVVDLDT